MRKLVFHEESAIVYGKYFERHSSLDIIEWNACGSLELKNWKLSHMMNILAMYKYYRERNKKKTNRGCGRKTLSKWGIKKIFTKLFLCLLLPHVSIFSMYTCLPEQKSLSFFFLFQSFCGVCRCVVWMKFFFFLFFFYCLFSCSLFPPTSCDPICYITSFEIVILSSSSTKS